MRMRLAVSVLAVVSLTLGCAEDPEKADVEDSPSPTTSRTPSEEPTSGEDPIASATPSAEPDVDPAARKELRTAQKSLVRANTGSVQTVTALGPARLEYVASYELRSQSMDMLTTITSPDGTKMVTHAIAIGQDAWFRIEQGPDGESQTCWINADPAAIQSATGMDIPVDSSRGVPGGVIVAVNANAVATLDDGRFLSRIDLYSLAAAFGGKFPGMLGVEYDSRASGPLTITVVDGTLVGWRASLVDLLQAVEEAGLPIPSELQGFEQQLDGQNAQTTAEISDLGKPVSIQRPDPDKTVSLATGGDEFKAAMEACEAR